MNRKPSKRLPRLLIWFLMIFMGLGFGLLSGANERRAVLLDIDGAIGPATMDYVVRGIDDARRNGAELIILRMDTPGGLDSAMRDMIKAILASPVPVVSYVAPAGARAASAGTYILYASHIAAMAPATTLGAATPVQMGGIPGMPDEQERPSPRRTKDDKAKDEDKKTDEADAENDEAEETKAPRRGDTAMERKVLEDAVAFIRGLAERHGRNADWAEEAVREAVSLTSSEALKQNVIDVVAESVDDLLEQIHGRTVKLEVGERVLDTENLEVVEVEPDWRSRLLSVITNPNIAYILMLVGIYGIIFELSNPGSIFPGVIGAISLVLALYALHLLPINYAGLALIILGVVFMIAEAFMPSFGVLGFGGILAFVVGSIILIDEPTLNISIPLIGGTALVSAGLFIWILGKFVSLRRRKAITGEEQLIGSIGTARDDFEGEGRVWLHSESWIARSAVPVSKGQKLRVTAVDGLRLTVEPVVDSSEMTTKGATT